MIHNANIKRLIVYTYQSVSGAGSKAIEELQLQTKSLVNNEQYHKALAASCGDDLIGMLVCLWVDNDWLSSCSPFGFFVSRFQLIYSLVLLRAS